MPRTAAADELELKPQTHFTAPHNARFPKETPLLAFNTQLASREVNQKAALRMETKLQPKSQFITRAPVEDSEQVKRRREREAGAISELQCP
ncbi:hypothetical protein BaRGS_00035425 [Batillaria attramentaria]|uniref:TPX2 central domain-containing protein n=1 Tax=Batillaria attramentaria TaxID=370345 RepID=A0ABD0JEN0_9CAEN